MGGEGFVRVGSGNAGPGSGEHCSAERRRIVSGMIGYGRNGSGRATSGKVRSGWVR